MRPRRTTQHNSQRYRAPGAAGKKNKNQRVVACGTTEPYDARLHRLPVGCQRRVFVRSAGMSLDIRMIVYMLRSLPLSPATTVLGRPVLIRPPPPGRPHGWRLRLAHLKPVPALHGPGHRTQLQAAPGAPRAGNYSGPPCNGIVLVVWHGTLACHGPRREHPHQETRGGCAPLVGSELVRLSPAWRLQANC